MGTTFVLFSGIVTLVQAGATHVYKGMEAHIPIYERHSYYTFTRAHAAWKTSSIRLPVSIDVFKGTTFRIVMERMGVVYTAPNKEHNDGEAAWAMQLVEQVAAVT